MRFFPIHIFIASLICAGSTAGVAASYAPAAAISPGAQVVDLAGNPVGTVQSVRGTELILKTDRHEVRLPVQSFTPDRGKLVFGMTRDALNRATDAMLAKAFLPGAEVHGKNGALAGHIEAIDEQFVTVELQSGGSIRLPRESVGPGSNGAVLGITVAELAKAYLPGAEVHGKSGALIGHIEAIDKQFVTVELQSGDSIRLPWDSIGPGSNGAVIGITVAELQQMVRQATAQTP